MKKEHENEVNTLKQKVQGMEVIIRCLFKQSHTELDNEALNIFMSNVAANENTVAPRSFKSTNFPNLQKS
ncbi:hypothetical protein Lal_00000801 [Lupinus albus]|nr:hypothetical protein Lal_00000801 [Lupinus albus]